MLLPPKLLRTCSIANGEVRVDGKVVATTPGPFDGFAEAAYRARGIDYPKFHKMDNLSKLGFLAAEFLLAGTDLLADTAAGRRGIVLGNATSSLDTDLRYQAQVMQQRPSPALFVYTLPNIVLGEICIRHGIKGESLLLVTANYEAAAQVSYLAGRLGEKTLTIALGGWLDYAGSGYRAFLYVVGASSDSTLPAFSAENVQMHFIS
ncbi:MAG: 3-oxoacyl-ACP synthase [Bacteroidota bacterium]|nr:3-oxoacyl-ACP synthase [Bacteroidota bacterium]